jgi:hypothetical protein
MKRINALVLVAALQFSILIASIVEAAATERDEVSSINKQQRHSIIASVL